jgi:TonB family protein
MDHMRQHRFGAVLVVLHALALSLSGCSVQTPAARSVQRPVAASDDPRGPGLWPSSRDYYPLNARRLGITGRVGLECSVDERGYARDIVILESAGPVLDEAARKVLSDQHFRVPDDWSATAGPAKRFRYGVIFRLTGKPDVARFEDNRHFVIITSYGG